MTAPVMNGSLLVEQVLASRLPTRPALRDRLLTLTELAQLPPNVPLVDGLLYRNTTAQLAGPPGSYKSFIGVDLACSVALGMPWHGHRVPTRGVVIYVAAEGASGLRTRIYAWCERHGVDPRRLDDWLFVLPTPLLLGDAADVREACDAAVNLNAALLILDTRSRCTLGLAENDATEQGEAIAAVDRIQQAAGCTILAIHHTGRTGEYGRGSNAWDGAVWSDLRLKGGDLRGRIHCEKHKEVPDGCDHPFRLVPHTVSEHLMPQLDKETAEEWTTRRSTLVAVQTSQLDDLAGGRQSDRTVLDIVRTNAGADGSTRAEIARLAAERGVKRSTAYEAVKALVGSGLLRNVGTDKRARYVSTSPVVATEGQT